MYQYQIQATKPITTAHLAQTMTLLEMTSEELSQKIESELAKNPALDLVDERRCPTCKRSLIDPGPCPLCSRPKNTSSDEPIVFVSSYSEHSPKTSNLKSDYFADELPDDNIAPETDLPSYILRQISSDLDVDDRLLAAHILTSIDDDGLLRTPLLEISRYHHVSISRIQKIIGIIQKADPIGVGSPSPKDALLVQLKASKNLGKKCQH